MDFTKEELYTIESHFDQMAAKHVSASPSILIHYGGVLSEKAKTELINELENAYTLMRTISAKCQAIRTKEER